MSFVIDPRPEDIGDLLAALDLTVEDLLVPVRTGSEARRTSTRHHPRTYGGWRDYAERTAALRDGLVSRGWTAEEPKGLCLTVHPDRRWAVMTAIGTAGTGTSGPVTTVRRRGVVTQQIVTANAQQQALPLDLPEPELLPGRMQVWALLVHPDVDVVRSELSLAAHMDDDGYIDRWITRIPLPVVRLNEMPDSEPRDEPPPPPDFDVPEL